MATADGFDPHILDIFIQYERLTLTTTGDFLLTYGNIGDMIADSYMHAVGFRIEKLPTLIIESIHTGNSVKFMFGESWLPSVTSDKDHDIIVRVPRKLGIPIFCGFLLLTSAKLILEVQNEYLDNQIKHVELQLKRTELQKVLERKPPILEHATEQSIRTVQRIIDNSDLKVFEVYGTNLLAYRKNGDQPSDDEKRRH